MSKKRTLALDIGGTFVKTAVIEDGKQIFDFQFESNFEQQDPSEGWILLFKTLIKPCTPYLPFSHLGISIPGTFNYHTQEILTSPNLPILNHRNIQKDVQANLPKELSSCKLTLMNDADAAAQGIATVHGEKHFLVMTLGTGCGSALVVNGKLWIGPNAMGCELGHVQFDDSSKRKCRCGKQGCIETYLGEYGLAHTAQELYPEKKFPEDHLAKHLVEEAKKQNPHASHILKKYGKHVGLVISNVANFLGIQTFFLYGGISKGVNTFSEGIQEGLKEGQFAYRVSEISVKPVDPTINYAALGLSSCRTE